ncbi:MAG: thioredoxin family protein [Chitinophagaceae bacterium]
MQFLWTSLLSIVLLSSIHWETDFAKAKQSAKTEHKLILLNFSGSDWCGPCIRMHKEIFESKSFTQYAGDHLVLVNADFPRLKKHQLPDDQLKRNNQLAEAYNKEGDFPFTLLLTEEGIVLKTWHGLPKVSPEAFVEEIKEASHANK